MKHNTILSDIHIEYSDQLRLCEFDWIAIVDDDYSLRFNWLYKNFDIKEYSLCFGHNVEINKVVMIVGFGKEENYLLFNLTWNEK